MSKKKRKFSAEFKAKVALDALSGELRTRNCPASTKFTPIRFQMGNAG